MQIYSSFMYTISYKVGSLPTHDKCKYNTMVLKQGLSRILGESEYKTELNYKASLLEEAL